MDTAVYRITLLWIPLRSLDRQVLIDNPHRLYEEIRSADVSIATLRCFETKRRNTGKFKASRILGV